MSCVKRNKFMVETTKMTIRRSTMVLAIRKMDKPNDVLVQTPEAMTRMPQIILNFRKLLTWSGERAEKCFPRP